MSIAIQQVERHPKKMGKDVGKGDQIFFNDKWRKIIEAQDIGTGVRFYFQGGHTTIGYTDKVYVFDGSIVTKDMFGMVFLAAFVLPVSIAWGVVISKAWEWFVVPVFEVNQMPVILAAVIVLCFRSLLPVRKPEDDVPTSVRRAIAAAIFGPGLTMIYLLFLSRFV